MSHPNTKTFSQKIEGMYEVNDKGCWLWQGWLRNGYAAIRDNVSKPTKELRVHRLMQAHTYGPIHKDAVTCHTCESRHCINPEHAYMGTPLENGRLNHSNVQLTMEIAREVRASTERGTTLAEKYGVTASTICDIRTNRTWRES
jgi:hypothetical protein